MTGRKKVWVITFRVLLVVALLEIGLRLSGELLLVGQDKSAGGEDGNMYRIVALGQSTTANNRNGRSSWPDELQAILGNTTSNVTFAVMNWAIPGPKTSGVIDAFEKKADKYQIDMVISMFEIPSGPYVEQKRTMAADAKRLMNEFRLYKVLAYVVDSLKPGPQEPSQAEGQVNSSDAEKNHKEEEERLKKAMEADPHNINALFDLAKFYESREMEEELGRMLVQLSEKINQPNLVAGLGTLLLEHHLYAEAEHALKKSVALQPDYKAYMDLAEVYKRTDRPQDAIQMYERAIEVDFQRTNKVDEHALVQLVRLYRQVNETEKAYNATRGLVLSNSNKGVEVYWLRELAGELEKNDEAIPIIMRTVSINPDNYHAWTELAWFYLNNNRPQEAESVFTKVSANVSNLISVYDELFIRFEAKDDSKNAGLMFDRAVKLRGKFYNPTAQQDYRRLYKLTKDREMKLAVMQHPGLDVGELKELFRGDEEVLFISNKENFEQALARIPYDELFGDSEYARISHPTLKGNRIIAENVASVVLKELGIAQKG